MIRLSELNLLPGERDLRRRAAKLLHLHEGDILDLKIVRRAVDARKKPQVRLVYTVHVAVKGDEEAILNRCPKAKKAPDAHIAADTVRCEHFALERVLQIAQFAFVESELLPEQVL